MAEKLKRLTLIFMILTLAAQSFIVRVASAENISFGDVVINEIAWAGSNDGAGDEWIELYNNSDHDINLRGWSIDDDGSSSYEIEEGVIKAKHYFVIEDKKLKIMEYDEETGKFSSAKNEDKKAVIW